MPIYTRRPNVRTGRRILRFVQRVFGPRRPAPIWAAWLCTFLILPSLAMAEPVNDFETPTTDIY